MSQARASRLRTRWPICVKRWSFTSNRPVPPPSPSFVTSKSTLPPTRPLAYREIARRLGSAGFSEGTRKGSHVKFVKETNDGVLTAIVPRHREVAIGILRSILRQSRLTPRQFESL